MVKLYNQKQKTIVERYNNATNDQLKKRAEEEAITILKMCEKWMKDGPTGCFVLGCPQYTLGDVLLTTMLTRLQSNENLFNKNVVSNPILNQYWKRVQSRPSYKSASITAVYMPSTF